MFDITYNSHYNRIGELDKAEKKLIEAFNEVNSLNSLLDKSEIRNNPKTNSSVNTYKFLK